jgi:hypothetical protein
MKLALKKFAVILITALVSITVTAVHASIVWPAMIAKTRGLDPNTEDLVTMPMIFETCVVSFMTAYYLGPMLARRIGDLELAALLKAQESYHMRLLHAFSGVFIITSRYFLDSYYGAKPWQNGLMICFGVFLIVKAIFKPRVNLAQTGVRVRDRDRDRDRP